MTRPNNNSPLSDPKAIKAHMDQMKKKDQPEIKTREKILTELIASLKPIDFLEITFPEVKALKNQLDRVTDFDSQGAKEIERKIKGFRLREKDYVYHSIKYILEEAKRLNLGLCKHHEFIYVYNGCYWVYQDTQVFEKCLGDAAEKLGVPEKTAQYYEFKQKLLKQFISAAYLDSPETSNNQVLVNLKNGTYEISQNDRKLRNFDPDDFLTYQLPFNFDSKAKAPIFQKYLNRVLPDQECQKVLAEYIGALFIRNSHSAFKIEKALILYGSGANGKSVFFEIINALLGSENVSNYTLQNLTDNEGYRRAMIADKLVNYASEINQKLDAATFKQLVSGEPIEARLPYGKPLQIENYARLIFNCNELPRDVEQTNAFFRRFLIIPFNVTIPEKEQDKELHHKIIQKELSGVFNWVLAGLERLLKQKGFTPCEASEKAVQKYKIQSDSVRLFLEEEYYKVSEKNYLMIGDLYIEYRSFCYNDGYSPVNKTNFKKRLINAGVPVERKRDGNVAYLIRKGIL